MDFIRQKIRKKPSKKKQTKEFIKKISKKVSHKIKEKKETKKSLKEEQELETSEIEVNEIDNSSKAKTGLKISIPIFASLGIILLLFVGIAKAVKSIDFTLFLSVAGEELQTDTNGSTNFLLVGTGGKNHDGGDLTDTILIASLNQENKSVSMISIPRDLWIQDEIVGSSRINEVYFYAKNQYDSSRLGMEHFQEKVEEVLGIPIHYYVKVDFKGFKEIIDVLGGVNVNVEEAISDPFYPKDGTYGYEPFYIDAGEQILDGETALKFARSRKTTSDFDRSHRQQQIIFAIKEKALETEIIFSGEKITELLETFKENIETNITVKEILTLGSIADEYSREQITQSLIHDDPASCGGFLYTPNRDYYGGMFVLIPAGGFDFIHKYVQLNFAMTEAANDTSQVHILNGTKVGGTAGEAKQIFKRFCVDVNRFGNASTQDLTQTTYYYKQRYDENGEPIDSRPAKLDFLQTLIPGQESTQIPTDYQEYLSESDIILEIGSDYTSSPNYIDDPFYSLYTVAPPAAITTPTPETSDEESTNTNETTEEVETTNEETIETPNTSPEETTTPEPVETTPTTATE